MVTRFGFVHLDICHLEPIEQMTPTFSPVQHGAGYIAQLHAWYRLADQK